MISERSTAEEFRTYLESGFTVQLDGVEPIALDLVEVKDLGEAYSAGGRRPFALYFMGPVSDRYLPQATYRMEHAVAGSLDIFIVPLGPLAGRMRYEAIFG